MEDKGEKKNKKVRKEGRAAAGRLKPYLNYGKCVTFTQTLPYPSPSSHGGPASSCPREAATA